MAIKLIASDLDGTIIDSNNAIAPMNFEAVETIHNKNINFAICTGKTYALSKDICNKFQASFGIFGNGSQIINLKTGEEIFKSVLPLSDVISIIQIAKKQGLHVHIYTEHEMISEKLLYMDLRNFKIKDTLSPDLKIIITPDILDFVSHLNHPIYKVIISSDFDLTDIKNLFDEQNFSISHITKRGKYKDHIIQKEYEYLDISPKNIDKSEALSFLGKYLNLSSHEIMSIGDNKNDFNMIKSSGIGVAVGNAHDDIKKVATYTTKSEVEKGAFAEAIYTFLT